MCRKARLFKLLAKLELTVSIQLGKVLLGKITLLHIYINFLYKKGIVLVILINVIVNLFFFYICGGGF